MKINIVTEPAPGWILRSWAKTYEHYLGKLGHDVIVNTFAISDADINLYINYALYKGRQGDAKDVAVFTHKENDHVMAGVFDNTAHKVDLCLAMSNQTFEELPVGKVKRILVPPHPQFLKEGDVNVGVLGRTYHSGRKNEDWLPLLREICGINIITTYDKQIPFEEMPALFDSLDYLLVIASNEGGPMVVPEAIARRVPVIAPNVGFSWEHPVIKYKDFNDLKRVLRWLVIPSNSWEIAAIDLERHLLTLMSN